MAGLPLSKETQRRVAVLFSGQELKTATELLVEFCGNGVIGCEDYSPEQMERIRYAALKLSKGRIDLLCRAIDLANMDWRDLLMDAGFGRDVKAHLAWEPKPPQKE